VQTGHGILKDTDTNRVFRTGNLLETVGKA
jgi:hypothetical protein